MAAPQDSPGLHQRTRVVVAASGKGGVVKSSLAADAGEPVVWAEPDLPVSRAIAELARLLAP